MKAKTGQGRVWRLALALAALAAGCAREPVAVRIAKGQTALREGRYREAADHLRRAVRARPDSAILHFNLGMAELLEGRHARAAQAFERSARLTADDSTDALEGLGRARQLQRRWADAARAYEEAINRRGRLPHLLAALAANELHQQRGDLALSLLAEALAQNPDEPVALYNMARVQHDAFGDAPAAVAYFRRFLEVAPPTEAAARERAQAALQELGDMRPETSVRSQNLIMRARLADDPREALELAERAAGEDPLSADALWNLCIALIQHRADHDRTVRAHARFAHLFPRDGRIARIPAAYRPISAARALESARAAVAAGRWPAAVAAYRQALAVDERQPAVWVELGNAAKRIPDLNLAFDAANRALALQAELPDALYLLGVVQFQLGRREQAFAHIRRYLELAPAGAHRTAVAKWLREVGG